MRALSCTARRHAIGVLVALTALVGCLASAPVVAHAEGPSVAAYDGASTQIDVPYVFRGGGQTATYLTTVGVVSWLPPNWQTESLSDLEAGPFYFQECTAVGGCGSGMGKCGEVLGAEWPLHTLLSSGCYSLSVPTGVGQSVGVLEVAVPLTAEAGGHELVFDHWTVTAGAPSTEPPRCRVGDMGTASLSWDKGPFEPPNGGFAAGASYRAWVDTLGGVGTSGSFAAHYADRVPDTTAPMIDVGSPFDCQWVKGGSAAKASFSCDDMGGSGVSSCTASGDISGTALDTSSEGEKSFTVTAVDNAGHERTRTVRYFVDGKPPTLTITANPSAPTGKNGWYDIAQLGAGAALPYTVSVSDGGTGMYHTWCGFDGNPEERVAVNQPVNEDPYVFPPEQYTATPVSTNSPLGDGAHTVACHAQDRLQQDTGLVTKTFKVETSVPAPAQFTSHAFDSKTWCIPLSTETMPAYRPHDAAWSSTGDASGLVGPSSGLLRLDTTPTASAGEPRLVQAPTIEDQAGNTTPGSTCKYFVGSPTVTHASSAVSCPPGSVVLLAPIACEVTLSDEETLAPVSPTGAVTATVNGKGTILGPCTLAGADGTATCTFQYTPSTIGTGKRQVTVAYPGDTSHDASSPAVAQIKVTPRATSTALVCEQSTIAVGQPDTCTATVTDSSPGQASTPGGNVLFAANPANSSFTPASCTLTPTGSGSSASCQTTFRATAGPRRARPLEAQYRGGQGTHAHSRAVTSIVIG